MASNPIPTWYRGILYRSRTEARWAKFFDALDLKFRYEEQGFDTNDEWYLPDFLIFAPCGNVWAEIKPDWRSDPEGIAKFQRWVPGRPQPSRAVLLTGVPTVGNKAHVYGGDDNQDNPLKGAWEDAEQEWRPCPSGHHFDLAFPGLFNASFAEDECPPTPGWSIGEDRIAAACVAALTERFPLEGNRPAGTAA